MRKFLHKLFYRTVVVCPEYINLPAKDISDKAITSFRKPTVIIDNKHFEFVATFSRFLAVKSEIKAQPFERSILIERFREERGCFIKQDATFEYFIISWYKDGLTREYTDDDKTEFFINNI